MFLNDGREWKKSMRVVKTTIRTRKKSRKKIMMKRIFFIIFAVSCAIVAGCMFIYMLRMNSSESFPSKAMSVICGADIAGIISGIVYAVMRNKGRRGEYVEEIKSFTGEEEANDNA